MLLGARQFFERRGTPAWQNPYVTDGLVAMWDGEWNAGGGVHDSAATTWVDLVGGNGYGSFRSGVSFGDNYLKTPSNSTQVALLANDYSGTQISTIECVVSLSGWNGLVLASFRLDASGNMDRWIGFRANGTFNFGSGLTCANASLSANETAYFAGTVDGNGNWTLYRNGVAVSTIGSGMFYGVGYNGHCLMPAAGTTSASKIFNMRLSSRAFTAAEIAANYAIDKARFNLP